MNSKVCSKCGKELPLIYFAIDRSIKDGLSSDCRECRRKRENPQWHIRQAKKRRLSKTLGLSPSSLDDR
jgi:DNA-directed RNA polymerase subunit RPC12/RpoP